MLRSQASIKHHDLGLECGLCFSHECFLDIQELPNEDRNIIREYLTILQYQS